MPVALIEISAAHLICSMLQSADRMLDACGVRILQTHWLSECGDFLHNYRSLCSSQIAFCVLSTKFVHFRSFVPWSGIQFYRIPCPRVRSRTGGSS